MPVGDEIQIAHLPNTFNRYGAINQLCVLVHNATFYEMRVYNRWGLQIAHSSGPVSTNPLCICGGTDNDCNETVYVTLDLSNCSHSTQVGWNVYVVCGSNKKGKDENSKSPQQFNALSDSASAQSSSNHVSTPDTETAQPRIYPTITTAPVIVDIPITNDPMLMNTITIYNLLGQPVYHNPRAGAKTIINLSAASKGLYLVKVVHGSEIFNERIVVH